VGDGGLALFGEQGDELFLLGNQRVDLGGFAVEKGEDGVLLFDRRNANFDPLEDVPVNRSPMFQDSISERLCVCLERSIFENAKGKPGPCSIQTRTQNYVDRAARRPPAFSSGAVWNPALL